MAKLHHPHAGLLLVRNAKQTMIPLTKDVTTIGRKQADILLDDPKISATHAEIRREENTFILVDRKSTNGTFLNRKRIDQVELTDQDVIEIGLSTLCFFKDRREFHGETEQPVPERPKSDTASFSVARSSTVTTTQTAHQKSVEIAILEGPQAGKSYQFKKSHIVIGRNDADLTLTDLDVSRSHALLEVFGQSSVYLRDLGSTNGTFRNGQRIQSEKLKSGDTFVIGNTTIKVSFESGEATGS